MRRWLLAFAALMSFSWPAFAQADATPPKRGFLWEAHKGAHKIYLMGTIHVGRAEFYPPHPDYLRRLDEAAAIVVEANVFDARRVAEAIQKTALYPDAEAGLGSRLSEAQQQRVTALINRFGLDPVRIWRMKPWMAANTFVILHAAQLGFNPAFATEAFLFQHAGATGKPLLEIESIEAQLALFERVDTATQVAYLEQVLKGIESGAAEREVRRIVSAWERRDAAEAERLIADIRRAKTPGERFVAEQLFDARHARMVEAIDRFAASGKLHLVAVGSLHYFGPNGLLELLRARGYAIVPL